MEINKISCAAELKLAIQTKQFQQEIAAQVLRDECVHLYRGLSAMSQIKNMLTDNSCAPYLKENIFQEIRDVVMTHFFHTGPTVGDQSLLSKVLRSVTKFVPAMIINSKSMLVHSMGIMMVKIFLHRSDKKSDGSDFR